MSDSTNSIFDEEHRTMGQSILYWGLVYLVAVPVTFLGVGFVVRLALVSFN